MLIKGVLNITKWIQAHIINIGYEAKPYISLQAFVIVAD
jgi:hypothetical protein